MCFKSISILKCSEGDILASDVYSRNGYALVVAKDTMLNDYIKERLINLGIGRVNIYDDGTQLIGQPDSVNLTYKRTVEMTRDLFQNLITGQSIDHKKVSVIAGQIMKCLYDNENIIKCLIEVRGKDEYTYHHSVNVAFYAMLIGKWLKLSGNEIYKAVISGLLHDIGKIKVPNVILNKAGRLSGEEFDMIKNHTIYGYEMVNKIGGFDQDIMNAILLHHERMDGSGYPYGYKPDDLNVYTRIVSVADVFDAMTSERVYKNKSTPFEVFQMFLTIGVSMFDIGIQNVFMKNLINLLIGSKVLLSDGETGNIVFIPQNDFTSPIVKVANQYIDLAMEKLKIIKII